MSALPSVSPVRTVEPHERQAAIDACMKQAGFPSSDVPQEQATAYNEQFFTCMAKFPVAEQPGASDRLNKEQLGIVYDFMVNTEIPCIEGRGFTVDHVPSRETFVNNFYQDPFWPYEQVLPDQLSPDQRSNEFIAELQSECPQWPPSSELYGSG